MLKIFSPGATNAHTAQVKGGQPVLAGRIAIRCSANQPETCRPDSSQMSQARVVLDRRRLLMSMLTSAPMISQPARATDGSETSQLYDKAAGTYDRLDGGFAAKLFGLTDLRKQLIGRATGRVLEVGVGTGLNLPLYNVKNVESFRGLDASAGMLEQASLKLAALGFGQSAALQEGNVEDLPFAEGSFDTVVSTYSLCVFQRPQLALQEMARVLRPSGKVLLLEHSRSNISPLAAYQDLTALAIAATSKGCVWNQDLPQLLKGASLSANRLERHLGGLITLVEAQQLQL